MHKKIVIIALTLIASYSSAQTHVDSAVSALSSLLTDKYSSIVPQTIHMLEDENRRVSVITFSIEGYNLGNNFQQFLAVFKDEYSKSRAPPSASYGEPKARLVGYPLLCPSPLEVLKKEFLQIVGSEIEGACYKTGSSDADALKFEVVIMTHGINIIGTK
jgi:hypothetical protein